MSRAVLVAGLSAALAASAALTTATAAGAATARPGGPARASAALAAEPAVTAQVVCKSAAHPALAARIVRGVRAAMRTRSSVVGFTVDDRVKGVTCTFKQGRRFYSASVVKVTILAALLRKLAVKHQYLTSAQAALATKMITVSDNNAASALWNQVGRWNLQHFLNLAQMKQTELGPGGEWGLTQITAHDELLLLKLLTSKNSVLDSASRSYELSPG